MAISIQKKAVKPSAALPGDLSQWLGALKRANSNLSLQKKVRPKEIMFFTSQLSLLVESGVPVNSSIQAIAPQIENPVFKAMLNQVVQHIEEGQSLSGALSLYPDTFPPLYVRMIRAGEESGQLQEMLDWLLVLEKKNAKIQSTLRSALAYPVFLVLLSISAVIFILAYVFPQFGTLFEEIRDELPLMTKVLLAISDVLRLYWPAILVSSVVGLWTLWKVLRTQRGKEALDRIFLATPVLKNMILKFHISQLMRSLGVLLKGGVNLLEALQISSGVVMSPVFGRFMEKLVESVEGGKGFAHQVIETPFLPQIVKQMVKTGEDTGNLSKVMGRISDYYDEQLEENLDLFSKVLEPLMLVVMGVVVGALVLSLIMPIFKLTRSIH